VSSSGQLTGFITDRLSTTGHGGRLIYPTTPQGEVKIETAVKGESIYVDGGYAGMTGKLKKFALRPGNHLIEVRDASGRDVFENVRVLDGRTVEIHC
jgi:hypothetical protein